MHDDLIAIITDGVKAPSGENCQPWKFKVNGSTVSIFNIPEADQSLYNTLQQGSYIAHGALIETIVISAKVHGYSTTVSIFPDEMDETHVADIVFEKSTPQTHPLYDSIPKRCTNRKEYSGEKLTAQQKKELYEVTEGDSARLMLLDDDSLLHKLGHALALNERILFENKKIHDFFYNHILWNKEDEAKAGGFYIDTLEFLPHQLGPVRLFKHWNVLAFLNTFLPISRKISEENALKYAKSGTFGALCITSTTKEEYVAVGRSIQKVWLAATRAGLAFHPCNGTIYFMDCIKNGGENPFSRTHNERIQAAYKELQDGFGSQSDHLAFVFRIGKADPPTSRSMRHAPQIEFS